MWFLWIIRLVPLKLFISVHILIDLVMLLLPSQRRLGLCSLDVVDVIEIASGHMSLFLGLSPYNIINFNAVSNKSRYWRRDEIDALELVLRHQWVT
jgi:hypothetical protein